jgi:hypothetical protein
LGSQVVVMPGQQHTAMNTAPDLFLKDVLEFLLVPAHGTQSGNS